MGRWLEALSPLRTALRLSPSETKSEITPILADALFGAAVHEFTLGHFKESVQFFREALDLQPESGTVKGELFKALLALGGALLSKGKTTEAIAAFSDAVKLDPTIFKGYLGLARAYFQNRDFKEAIRAAGNALRISPNNKEVKTLLSELLNSVK